MTVPGSIDRNLWNGYVAVLTLLLLVCYGPAIFDALRILCQTGDVTRAIFPPAVAAYVIWNQRSAWASLEIAPAITGLAPLLAGVALAALATAAGSLTLFRVAFLLSVCGCILITCGSKALRLLTFPLLLLLFAFPIPAPLYFRLAAPLQAVATRGAEIVLTLFQFHAVRAGNSIYLPSQILVVSQACGGIQSLLTLTFFSLLYGYWAERNIWLRAIIVAASLPAWLLMNVTRVAVTGMIGEVNRRYTEGGWHAALGYLTLVSAFCLVMLLHDSLRRCVQARADEA